MRNRLQLYRRCEKHCRHYGKPRKWIRRNPNRCACPIHCGGTLINDPRDRVRESMGTRNWTDALLLREEWERAGRIVRQSPTEALTIKGAAEKFIANKSKIGGLGKQGIGDETIRKYRELLCKGTDERKAKNPPPSLASYSAGRGVFAATGLTATLLDDFHEELAKRYVPSTLYERVGKMKAFLRYCWRKDFIAVDLASKIETPGAPVSKKPSYTQEQQIRILFEARQPLDKAFVLFMRYTGFSIEDAANCPKANLGPLEWFTLPDGRKIELARVWIQHRAKLGEESEIVEAWIPRFVVEALDASPHKSRTHWFKSDRANPKSAAKVMSARLLPIFKAAGVEGRSHGFRRTLSTSVLSLKGMTSEDAALLLGNTAAIVERYYSPKTQERQIRGKIAAALALANDPKVRTSGTSAAHEEFPRAN